MLVLTQGLKLTVYLPSTNLVWETSILAYFIHVLKEAGEGVFLARLHFSAEELLLYPWRRRQRPRWRLRPHTKS